MQVNSAINSAMLGYQQAMDKLDNAAQSIAMQSSGNSSPNTENSGLQSTVNLEHAVPVRSPESINSELINMQTAMYNGQAAIKVIKTADDMIGSSIDVRI